MRFAKKFIYFFLTVTGRSFASWGVGPFLWRSGGISGNVRPRAGTGSPALGLRVPRFMATQNETSVGLITGLAATIATAISGLLGLGRMHGRISERMDNFEERQNRQDKLIEEVAKTQHENSRLIAETHGFVKALVDQRTKP